MKSINQKIKEIFIPQKIREAREKLGISGEELCRQLVDAGLSISRQTLSSWENGETWPTAKQMEILFYVLGQPVRFFFALKNSKTSQVSNRSR